MDEAIRTLKSTTFFGRRLTRRQIAEVQKTVRDFPALSRRELGHTICEHLGWHAPSGTDSIQSALGLLEALEEAGVVTLPRKDETRAPGRQRTPVRTARSEAPAPFDCALARHLEALLLRQAKLVHDVTLHVFDSIVQSRQAERPGRSYPRVSRQPIGKWKPGKPAKATASAYGGEPCRA